VAKLGNDARAGQSRFSELVQRGMIPEPLDHWRFVKQEGTTRTADGQMAQGWILLLVRRRTGPGLERWSLEPLESRWIGPYAWGRLREIWDFYWQIYAPEWGEQVVFLTDYEPPRGGMQGGMDD
jgi:hypothetical protein